MGDRGDAREAQPRGEPAPRGGDRSNEPKTDVSELYERALASPDGLRVSAVEGRPVARFGTPVFIGAERDPENPRKLVYRTGDVVTIPREEAERYRREYIRHITEGDLVLASAAAPVARDSTPHGQHAPHERRS